MYQMKNFDKLLQELEGYEYKTSNNFIILKRNDTACMK